MADELEPVKSRTAPAILITLSAVVVIVGMGRCGFLGRSFESRDDYGIGGAFFIVLGVILLLAGFIWRARRS